MREAYNRLGSIIDFQAQQQARTNVTHDAVCARPRWTSKAFQPCFYFSLGLSLALLPLREILASSTFAIDVEAPKLTSR